MKLRRFRIGKESISGKEAVIQDPGEIRHLRKVLRMRAGDEVLLFDGEGGEYRAVISNISAQEISFRLSMNPAPSAPEPPVGIILGIGLLKSSKFDWVLQKATELGVAQVMPFYSERVVPRLREESTRIRRGRWEKIAAEAAKQCGRATIPRIHPPVPFEEVLVMNSRTPLKILLWEGERARTLQGLSQADWKTVFALVGPEGGFSEKEVAQAQTAGFHPIRLGPRILRAETAAIAIVTLLQFIGGDLK